MVLQVAANRRWRTYKGDVSGAFLQGREYPDRLYCVPCPEILEAMGLPPNSVTRLKRACYGLVDAPLEWFRTVSDFLGTLGMERTWSDACCWTWRVKGELRGVISGHVDDFLFSGSEDDEGWKNILRQVKERFRWGDWESGSFVQCGVQIDETPEGYCLSQPKYLDNTPEIPLNASRRKETQAPTTEREKTSLRGVLGALSWHAQQVGPHVSADVGLLLSEVTRSTVSTVQRTNKLLNLMKARCGHKMLIHRMTEAEEPVLMAWVDAGSQNRVDGGSTQGIFIGMSDTSILRGEVAKVTPISWHSNRITRACRSPGAAETQAAVNGEDVLYSARFQWSELIHGIQDIRRPDCAVSKVRGCLVTDSRNVYDKLQTEVIVIKGAERRSDIELLSIKESQDRTGLTVRWVHSEAQLANGLTKAGAGHEMEMYYQMQHRWRIVEDVHMRSSRRRRAEGLAPLSADLKEDAKS